IAAPAPPSSRSKKWAAVTFSFAFMFGSKNTLAVATTRKQVNPANKAQLQSLYQNRFGERLEYRDQVWATLCSEFWQRLVPEDGNVLDVGCGYGQFINHIRSRCKCAMDLNPSTKQYLDKSVPVLDQHRSTRWYLPDHDLYVPF